MKIRTQLIAGIIIFTLILAVVSSLVIATNGEVEHLVNEEETANAIALEVGELGYLSNDYILYREPLQAQRWDAKYSSISDHIAALSLDVPEQQAIRNNLNTNLRNTRSVFDDIVASPVQQEGTDTGFVQLSWSRMAVQNQGMVFDAGRLAHLLQIQGDELRQTRTLLIFALMGSFVAFLLTSYFLFYRRTLNSIAELQNGAQIIGSGNLNYTIPEKSDDEIGELSRSFNQMTSDLKGVIATKSDLEREVTSRKRAEENLIRKNDDLNALNEELTATQEELSQNLQELTRVEQDLRKSEEHYRSLFETMAEGFSIDEIILDNTGKPTDLRYLKVNPAFERQTGLKAEDILGKTSRELFPDAEPVWFERYGKVVLTGEPAHFEEKFSPLGRWYDVWAYKTGEKQFAALFSDITDRKNAEEAILRNNMDLQEINEELTATQEELNQNINELVSAERSLRETSQYLENLIGYANAPIIVWDPQYRITRFNHAFEHLTGLNAQDVIGKPLEILFPENSREESMCRIIKTGSGERWESVEIPILHMNGEVRTVLWNSATLYLEDGKTVLSTIAQGQDITERKLVEEELRKTVIELKRSNQDLEQFAYIASHDLQEPLRNVTLFSQLFIRKYGDSITGEGKEYLDFVIEGSTRMSTLIHDLLDYSRITTRGEAFIPVDMNDVVEDACTNLQALIQESGSSVTFDPLPVVEADPMQIRQVFQNLIDNAVKYRSTDAPRVHISAVRKEHEWVFSVKDNGIGIAPEYHDRIFQLFKRLHTRQKYSGTGIGLSLVKKIIERHGGRIWVDSEEGKGATFYFTLKA